MYASLKLRLLNSKQADSGISTRLKNLQTNARCASEDEISSRLAKLKDLPPDSCKRPAHQAPNQRTETQQSDDLMKKVKI